MEFILILIVLSFPIFYLYGLVKFFSDIGQKRNNNKEENSPSTNSAETVDIIRQLVSKVKEDPEFKVKDFLKEYKQQSLASTPEYLSKPVTQTQIAFNNDSTFTQTPPAPTKNALNQPITSDFVSNWYKDNSIHLLLYVGAFLIVAAVSLFISFQWQSFTGLVKFGYVLVFTLGWFVASYALRQYQKLKAAAVTFATIGAILIPLTGLAYQQFVIGSFGTGAGFTWLVTSIISIAVYLYLSNLYKKRYFTYFANLSSLSTALAVVHISNSPAEFYVVGAIFSALILLIVRIFFIKNKKIEAFYGEDVENSSIVTLVLSVLVGLMLLSAQGIPFFSIEVSLVSVLSTLYVFLFYYHKKQIAVLGLLQVSILLTLAQILKTAEATNMVILFGTAITNLSMQLWFNHRFANDYQRFCLTKITSVISTGVMWFLATSLDPFSFEAVSFALLFAVHAALADEDLKEAKLHVITAVMMQVFVYQLVKFIGLDTEVVVSIMAGSSLLQLAASQLKVLSNYSIYHRVVSQFVLVIVSIFITLTMVDNTSPINEHMLYVSSLILLYVSYLFYSVTSKNVKNDIVRLEQAIITIILTLIALMFTVTSYVWLAIGLLGLITLQCLIVAVRHKNLLFINGSLLTSVIAIGFIGHKLDLPEAVTIVLFVFPPIVAFLYGSTQSNLEDKTRESFRCYGMTSATIISFLVFSWSLSNSAFELVDVTALLVGYISYVMIWKYLEFHPDRRSHYVKLFFGLLLYYWHVFFLQQFLPDLKAIGNVQVFSLPLGLAFIWASFRERQSQTSSDLPASLDTLAGMSVFGPTAIQALASGSFYSFLGVIYGMVLILIGNSTNTRRYQQIGAGAIVLFILSETGSFLFTLPRFIVIGLLGFGLIGAAIFLLAKRKENT